MTGGPPGVSSEPQISVSIVTYNSAGSLPLFLDCLRHQDGVTWEAFFFDNASQDRTRELIEKAALGNLFPSEANIGYGRAHNSNLAACLGRYVLVLNPDLHFESDLFACLLRALEDHPEYFLVGPRILEGPERRPFPPRRFYPGEGMIALEPAFRRREIAWVSGCCLMVVRDLFEKLGGFDPDYFLYQEETDLCLRARRAGYTIGYENDALVHHLHRRSQRELFEYAYAYRIFQGSAVFWEKHYAPPDVLAMVRFQYWMSRLLFKTDRMRALLPQFPSVLSQERLQARNDVCREWLHKRGHHRVGSGRVGKIALRQCRLIMEWILQREFPLDDY